MSVLIEDMKKPKFCYEIIDGKYEQCQFVNANNDCILLLNKGVCKTWWADQYSKCPLVETLEPCEDEVNYKAALDSACENDATKRLSDLIFDINPDEICEQIKSGNLRNWCVTIQTEMRMAMIQLPCWEEEDNDK